MRPGPWHPFVVLARALGLGAGALAVRHGGLAGVGLAAWAALALLRVPRRRLVVELGLVLALLALAGAPRALAAAGGAAGLVTLALAPERRLLRLNGMDRYFIAQDYPGVPMNTTACLELDAPLRRDALERAVAALHRDVPLFRSFVREAPLGVQRFVARRPFARALLDWRAAPLAEHDEALRRPFDLARQPPLRVVHAPRGAGATLLLTLHHSACDGEGMLIALDWLLQRYAEAARGQLPAPLALTVEGLRLRDVVRARGLGLGWLVRMVRRHLRPTGKLGVRNATMYDDDGVLVGATRHRVGDLPAESWAAVGRAAAARGVTRNDLLVSAALRAADAYRRGRGREDAPFRLMLPANLRATLGLGPGLQNFIGSLRAEFAADEVRDSQLPETVHARVRESLALDDAVETPINLGALTLLMPPWLLRRALRKLDADTRSSFFSFLFSHMRLAAPRPIPGAEITSLVIKGSLARRPGFGVAFARLGARATIAIEYMHPMVRDDSASEYLDAFLAEVDRIAAAAPAAAAQ